MSNAALAAKSDLIKKFQINNVDTGSVNVQVSLLTQRIKQIAAHLEGNKKDHSGRRSLLILVARRNRFLKYIAKRNRETYLKLCADLELKVKN